MDPNDSVVDACDEMEELIGVIGHPSSSHSNPQIAERPHESLPSISAPQADGIVVNGQALNATPVAPSDTAALDKIEHLDSWASESWQVNSVEGHRDGVTCVHWAEDLVLTGGR